MKMVNLPKLALVAILFFVVKVASAQTPPPKHFWANLTYGYGYLSGKQAGAPYAMAASFNWNINRKHLLSFRYSYSEQVLPDRHGNRIGDLGIMYGRIYKHKWFYASASLGLGVYECTKMVLKGDPMDEGDGCGIFDNSCLDGSAVNHPGDYKNIIKYGAGLAGEGQLIFTPLPCLGVGLTSYGNANLHRPFGGIGLTLLVGLYR